MSRKRGSIHGSGVSLAVQKQSLCQNPAMSSVIFRFDFICSRIMLMRCFKSIFDCCGHSKNDTASTVVYLKFSSCIVKIQQLVGGFKHLYFYPYLGK